MLIVLIDHVFFFFSSRRRHTRCSRDWSSDVCSSDLLAIAHSACHLTRLEQDVYTSSMPIAQKRGAEALFDLPCACQRLRRATRVVTRIYDQELAKAGIEITQYGLLTALDLDRKSTRLNSS